MVAPQPRDAKTVLAQAWDAIQKDQKLRAHYDVWFSKWPSYCRNCGASGEINYTENGAPIGEGFWAMPMVDACPRCIESGICPRCYATTPETMDEHKLPCPECGWSWGNLPDDLAPLNGLDPEFWDTLGAAIVDILNPVVIAPTSQV